MIQYLPGLCNNGSMTNFDPTKRYTDHPLVRYVHSMKEELYLAREAALSLGCSVATLGGIAKRYPYEGLGPSFNTTYGQWALRLYTPEQIEKIRKFRADRFTLLGKRRRRPGRTRLWSPEESHARARAADRVRYLVRSARIRREQGYLDMAADYEERAAKIRDSLDGESKARKGRIVGTGKR